MGATLWRRARSTQDTQGNGAISHILHRPRTTTITCTLWGASSTWDRPSPSPLLPGSPQRTRSSFATASGLFLTILGSDQSCRRPALTASREITERGAASALARREDVPRAGLLTAPPARRRKVPPQLQARSQLPKPQGHIGPTQRRRAARGSSISCSRSAK